MGELGLEGVFGQGGAGDLYKHYGWVDGHGGLAGRGMLHGGDWFV